MGKAKRLLPAIGEVQRQLVGILTDRGKPLVGVDDDVSVYRVSHGTLT
jgi:hypothetical protein